MRTTPTLDPTGPGPGPRPARTAPHALAALVAIAALGLVVAGGLVAARSLEQRYVHALAPTNFMQKYAGRALQVAALRQPDLLVVYGSSELVRPNDYHGSELFRAYPTGFTIFPVGRAGLTSMGIFQDVAAVGTALHGRRIVLSVSPSWFLGRLSVDPYHYAGSFSRLHAYGLAFSTALGHDLRRAAARRMLQYPGTVEEDPLLAFALQQLARDDPAGRVLYWAVWPLGKLEEAVLGLQDHWHTLAYILGQRKLRSRVQRVTAPLNWPDLVTRAEQDDGAPLLVPRTGPPAEPLSAKAAARRAHIVRILRESAEWGDLELLLRTLQALGARPLILSLPLAGAHYDAQGVSRGIREALYYDRLRETGQRFGIPVVDFAEFDADTGFLVDIAAHPRRRAWVYYAQAMDEFFHGTMRSAAEPPGRPSG